MLLELRGVFEDNCRSNDVFNHIEAVSFLDYNNDGYDDIIIICSYTQALGSVSTEHSEVRYYSGRENGDFLYEEQMSLDASSALADITVRTAKEFIKEGKIAFDKSWQNAYIEYLQQDSDIDNLEGYTLIYLDNDEIPELVEVGKYEARGCSLVNFFNNNINSAQLDRLNFTYIERENLLCNSGGLMDSYYDLVYSIIEGKLTLTAKGNYGAEDNSNIQIDAEGNIVYQYMWNDVKMSRDEYKKMLDSVYDTSKSRSGYDREELYSLDEMISLIKSLNY